MELKDVQGLVDSLTKYLPEILKEVKRLEVIDDLGRSYVKHLQDHQGITLSFQDDFKTLKVFID